MARDEESERGRAPGGSTTTDLIARAREGDERARDELFARHRPELVRLARGRLPRNAREMRDTDDLVQEAMIRSLARLPQFEPRHTGSFLAYLSLTVMNLVRDAVRATRRRPARTALEGVADTVADPAGDPESQRSANEAIRRYRGAMAKLSPEQHDAIVMRLELGLSYEAIAVKMGKPSVNAVRLLVSRGLKRLARDMAGEVG